MLEYGGIRTLILNLSLHIPQDQLPPQQILKSQIMTGELLPEKRIPTEKELAEIYHVSSITARQAIMRLVQEGLLRPGNIGSNMNSWGTLIIRVTN